MTTDAENKHVSLVERLVYAKLMGTLNDTSLRREIKRVSLTETDDGFRIGAIRPWLIGEKEKFCRRNFAAGDSDSGAQQIITLWQNAQYAA